MERSRKNNKGVLSPMNQKEKKYLIIYSCVAAALFIAQLFLQGVLYINSAFTFFRVVGDSLLVTGIIMFGVWVAAMAWYNGLFDAITYLKDGAGKLHLENGQVRQKKTIREYSIEKSKTRTKPTYLRKIWIAIGIPALLFSLIAILIGQ